jgi:hypothetical protein
MPPPDTSTGDTDAGTTAIPPMPNPSDGP